MISSALLALAFAAVLLGIGFWGRRNAASLVLRSLSESAQQRKERSIRRGALVSLAAGALFVVLGVFEIFSWTQGR